MILKSLTMAGILFFKIRTKFFSGKTLQARTFHGLSLHSEAIASIIRNKGEKGCFSVMIPFNFEVGVKGQTIQHLEKIPRP